MYTENLRYIPATELDGKKEYDSGFIVDSKNAQLIEDLEFSFSAFKGQYSNQRDDLINNWIGVDEGFKYIDKNLSDSSKTLNILLNTNQRPYAYRENNEIKGMIVQLIYEFAKFFKYKLNIIDTNTVEDFIPAVKNGSVDISVGYVLNEDISKETSLKLMTTQISSATIYVIRYDNSINSTEWTIPSSVEEFDGEALGCLKPDEDLMKSIFPESEKKIISSSYPNELFNYLLRETTDGVLVDKIILDYYLKNTDRLSYYDDILSNNSYGILFNSEETRNKFNEFLEKNYSEGKLNQLFNEWKNADENKIINKEYTTLSGNNILKVSFPKIRPMCYSENGVYKGYELDLLYQFAKENEYNIEINSENPDVYLGCKNITNNNYFSNPILNSSSVLAVRKDSIRKLIPIKVLDGNYVEENKIEIPVNVSGKEKKSSCVFPNSFYNNTILINCSISDLSESEKFNKEEIKYGNTNERIKLLYSSISAENLLKSNNIFSDNNLIKNSDTSNIICPDKNNTDNTDDIDDTDNSTNFRTYGIKKSSGLSTGGIVAIIIPCAAVLIGAIVAALMLGKTPAPVQTTSSEYQLNVR